MPPNKKTFIDDIDSEKKRNLIIPRDAPFETSYEDTVTTRVPKGTYNRIVIVATNIAEASITIPSLKFVVDTGNQKIGRYDYKSRDQAIESTPVSESSRVQRRGRVGRVASGTVLQALFTICIKKV
jgi:hypothetical protein